MTRLDGRMTSGELAALEKLGTALGVTEAARSQADGIAQDVAFLPAGDRPDRYDLARLRHILGARLAAAKALRNTQKKA
jgi:hypothetical protein